MRYKTRANEVHYYGKGKEGIGLWQRRYTSKVKDYKTIVAVRRYIIMVKEV